MTEQISYEETAVLSEKMLSILVGHNLENGLRASSLTFLKMMKNILSNIESEEVRKSLSDKTMENIQENLDAMLKKMCVGGSI